MAHLPAKAFFALALALPLTLLLSWGVLHQYQRALLRWMRREPAPNLARPAERLQPAGSEAIPTGSSSGPPLTLGSLQRQERRHWAWLAGLWLLIGFSAASLYLPVHGLPSSPFRILAISLVWAAPGWLQLGLMARLPWKRGLVLVLAISLGLLVVIIPMMVDTSGQSLLQLLEWVLVQGLLPLVALTMLMGIPSLRATAPPLYPAVAGMTLLATLAQLPLMAAGARLAAMLALPVAAWTLLALLLPLLVGAVPLHFLSRSIGAAYQRGWLNDHSYNLAAGALLVLLFAVVPGWSGTGPLGLLPLLAWLWVPLALGLQGWRRRQQVVAAGVPLLVLRLFRRPGPVGWLFDQVVQRWRFLGPVLLITASDLAGRTLDADELVQFLDGRLGDRFIAATETLPPPAADTTDLDGRHRVQEFCCYDSSWQMVLEQLLQRSQVVLMDLRGFGPSHRGCLHELGRLGASSHLQRVVLLADASTDRATADAALAARGAPAVVWVDERRRRHPTLEAVLQALTAAPATPG